MARYSETGEGVLKDEVPPVSVVFPKITYPRTTELDEH